MTDEKKYKIKKKTEKKESPPKNDTPPKSMAQRIDESTKVIQQLVQKRSEIQQTLLKINATIIKYQAKIEAYREIKQDNDTLTELAIADIPADVKDKAKEIMEKQEHNTE